MRNALKRANGCISSRVGQLIDKKNSTTNLKEFKKIYSIQHLLNLILTFSSIVIKDLHRKRTFGPLCLLYEKTVMKERAESNIDNDINEEGRENENQRLMEKRRTRQIVVKEIFGEKRDREKII